MSEDEPEIEYDMVGGFVLSEKETAGIYTILFVGSVRWVEETDRTRAPRKPAA